MLKVESIQNGVVIDHITEGKGTELKNVVKCTNPRCITSIEANCDHIFRLSPSKKYRCIYCNQEMPLQKWKNRFQQNELLGI